MLMCSMMFSWVVFLASYVSDIHKIHILNLSFFYFIIPILNIYFAISSYLYAYTYITYITLPMFIYISLKLCLHCLTLVYVKFLFTLHDKNLIHEISTYTCMLYLIVILVIFKLNFKLLNFLPKQFYQSSLS